MIPIYSDIITTILVAVIVYFITSKKNKNDLLDVGNAVVSAILKFNKDDGHSNIRIKELGGKIQRVATVTSRSYNRYSIEDTSKKQYFKQSI